MSIYIPMYFYRKIVYIHRCVYKIFTVASLYTNRHEQNHAHVDWRPGQELCSIEFDSLIIAFKIGFGLYLISLQKRKYLVSGRCFVVTARSIRNEGGMCTGLVLKCAAMVRGSCPQPSFGPLTQATQSGSPPGPG